MIQSENKKYNLKLWWGIVSKIPRLLWLLLKNKRKKTMKTLYYNGSIVTMAAKSMEEETYPEALLCDGKKIVAIGSLTEVKKLCDDETIMEDLKGATLMPGFIDAHSHLPMAANFAAFCDLSDCLCFSDIVKKLKAFQQENKITKESAVIGYNYDHNFLTEESHPDKTVLDQVSGEIPVFILHISSHMGVANSALLDMAGLKGNVPNPPGGRYGRMADGKELSGYLEEVSAFGPVMGMVYTRVKTDIFALLNKIQDTYLSYGVTTAQDGASSADLLKLLSFASMSSALKMDLVSYIESRSDLSSLLESYAPYIGTYKNHYKIGGLKVVLDGSPQAKTAWLSKPYEGEESYCGYPAWKDEDLKKVTDLSVKEGLQLLAHCNGDAASEQFLSNYEASLTEYGKDKDLRPVMIHCQTVRKDQLKRMAKINMIPSIFVGHVYFWGDVHKKNLGKERADFISPAGSALKLGLKVNFHQDTPVTAPDMLHSVWAAVNRVTRKGEVLGPDEKISVYDALKCVTINAAYAYFEEESKGSLEVGKLCDMVILDRNPLSVLKDEIKDIRVLKTIVHAV